MTEENLCQCGEYELDNDGCCIGCGYLEIECMCAPSPLWRGGYNTDYSGAFPNED